MRCLAIDYGARRWGLAYGDELGLASPLPALVEGDAARRWASLIRVAAERRVSDFVLGHPLNMDGTAGPQAREVEGFGEKLRVHFRLPVHLIDERLTSYEAESGIAPARRRELRRQGIVDSRAATIVLQDFLNLRFPLP